MLVGGRPITPPGRFRLNTRQRGLSMGGLATYGIKNAGDFNRFERKRQRTGRSQRPCGHRWSLDSAAASWSAVSPLPLSFLRLSPTNTFIRTLQYPISNRPGATRRQIRDARLADAPVQWRVRKHAGAAV